MNGICCTWLQAFSIWETYRTLGREETVKLELLTQIFPDYDAKNASSKKHSIDILRGEFPWPEFGCAGSSRVQHDLCSSSQGLDYDSVRITSKRRREK